MRKLVEKFGFTKLYNYCVAAILFCGVLAICTGVYSNAIFVIMLLGSFLFGILGLIIIYFKEEIPVLLQSNRIKGVPAQLTGYTYLIAGWGLCIFIIYSKIAK
jgi:hypothetical protein